MKTTPRAVGEQLEKMTVDESIAIPKVHTRSLAEVGSGKVVLVTAPLAYKSVL